MKKFKHRELWYFLAGSWKNEDGSTVRRLSSGGYLTKILKVVVCINRDALHPSSRIPIFSKIYN
ncbi:hypothetical protein [Chryseobacterium gallinarum]|uniref:hypothetical protein n=1 Tax=Chryseobacterium gallinarum TaxID=1324352 RepID=UPI000B0646B7|nr:hypothetical protein [Chryseobacterium gallinarum]MCL8538732.1 hypothetical protein [Chryseobacterium gallinarum]